MTTRYEVSLSSRTLPRVLLAIALGLLAFHAVLAFYHYRVHELPWLLRQLFDVDQENNLPTWYSGFLLALSSAILWITARTSREARGRWSRHWYALALGFLVLSVDEVAGVHETLNSVIVTDWAVPGAVLALAVGLAFVPFLLHLPKRTAVVFAMAGAAYLTGAIGIELVGSSLIGRGLADTLQYNVLTLAEEGLEMLGVILFLQALLDYMRAGALPEEVAVSVEVA